MTPRQSAERALALTVRCPFCHAPRGVPCGSAAHSTVLAYVHASRAAVARQVAELRRADVQDAADAAPETLSSPPHLEAYGAQRSPALFPGRNEDAC